MISRSSILAMLLVLCLFADIEAAFLKERKVHREDDREEHPTEEIICKIVHTSHP